MNDLTFRNDADDVEDVTLLIWEAVEGQLPGAEECFRMATLLAGVFLRLQAGESGGTRLSDFRGTTQNVKAQFASLPAGHPLRKLSEFVYFLVSAHRDDQSDEVSRAVSFRADEADFEGFRRFLPREIVAEFQVAAYRQRAGRASLRVPADSPGREMTAAEQAQQYQSAGEHWRLPRP
ncbi:hypothetical protein ACQ7DA_00120 [Zafaria sp. J156]|uniref:hypothetical protein n=1 Tax=Zafaria sp. J156 TaxID=3116490 RepID=UPI002E78A1E9|nr:hypothetical protein [Zafaria sp. J156]MEE1619791.1 hypothetical protein [Zafaria sp. J156]